MGTDKLIVDFIARKFAYATADGVERNAAFPTKNEPCLDDLARLLASARGWSNVGGQDEWWLLTFDEYMTEDDDFGVTIPNTFTLELTGCNPHKELERYVALRGSDPHLKAYGRVKGKDEEQFSHVSVSYIGLRFLYDRVHEGIREGAENGYIADGDNWLMRVIYRKRGENEFELRTPCTFQAPMEWQPAWE
ncbi:hypothetical protein [Mycobacterium intracellulare]|uniref:Uncharacterized protein n=1 Tax=Mycobacterium intracellulare subsp. chimaera TaxID=222805 RepID=A0A7U5MML3_MYCIT|nr:hypothetical protein [Mycobacterium intracellulare]ASL16267.1 hypothetical protein MYCOZU2_03893 [Mycobacterium intracellulare subsp. chimaera]ASQ87350.1 hypothetical protein CE197_18510 [Mycobacterium intracellulare subsp. chimaera]MCF1816006.1 hypothetical protein [Mycobacterium intracellulare subsp. intracellulare]MDM3929569.1 hypothetical protein [Mycobacterium intracellulare subsp. chimaera]MDS0337908.1 hypothetical protein [Mycobacterium intracellulare]